MARIVKRVLVVIAGNLDKLCRVDRIIVEIFAAGRLETAIDDVDHFYLLLAVGGRDKYLARYEERDDGADGRDDDKRGDIFLFHYFTTFVEMLSDLAGW